MTKPAEPSTPSGSSATTTKATDHELQKHDNFTRYGQVGQMVQETEAISGFGTFRTSRHVRSHSDILKVTRMIQFGHWSPRAGLRPTLSTNPFQCDSLSGDYALS